MQTSNGGRNALMWASYAGNLDAMRLLLDHPSADPAEMMMSANSDGDTVVMCAAQDGNVRVLRLLLDHPSADPAAMLAFDSNHNGDSALIRAATFAADSSRYNRHARTSPCAPLLFLLRRIAVEPQPSDAQQAHMTVVVEELSQVPYEEEDEEEEDEEQKLQSLFDDDQPDDARDECIRLLARIMRDLALLARVPQLINEAVVGMAISQQQQHP
jgi:hypothetical protein